MPQVVEDFPPARRARAASVEACGQTCSLTGRTFTCHCKIAPGAQDITFILRDRAGNESQQRVRFIGQSPPEVAAPAEVAGATNALSVPAVPPPPLEPVGRNAQGAAVLTQLAAVKAALDQVGLKLISQELRRCRLAGEDACEEDFEAALTTLLRYTTMAR